MYCCWAEYEIKLFVANSKNANYSNKKESIWSNKGKYIATKRSKLGF
jgi:hypothetical protein